MAKTEEQIIGEDFEKAVRTALDEIKNEHPLFFHRFPDSKSARGFIAAQPSDYLVGADGQAYLLEVKASGKYETFTRCAKSMIRPSQIGFGKLWNRAGLKNLFLFYSLNENLVELWNGEVVIKTISEGKRLNALKGGNGHNGFITEFDFFNLKEELINLFLRGAYQYE